MTTLGLVGFRQLVLLAYDFVCQHFNETCLWQIKSCPMSKSRVINISGLGDGLEVVCVGKTRQRKRSGTKMLCHLVFYLLGQRYSSKSLYNVSLLWQLIDDVLKYIYLQQPTRVGVGSSPIIESAGINSQISLKFPLH